MHTQKKNHKSDQELFHQEIVLRVCDVIYIYCLPSITEMHSCYKLLYFLISIFRFSYDNKRILRTWSEIKSSLEKYMTQTTW